MFKDHVQMTVGGKQAMVPVEHAKKVQKKQDLVAQVMRLQTGLASCTGVGHTILQEQLMETMGKIIRLSRRIPPCVKFI
jgi:hypothetical protein